MSFPRYPSYKDSRVEWLDEVPRHWGEEPLRTLAAPGRKSFIDGDWIEAPFITDEGIRLLQTGNIGVGRFKEQGYRYVSEETFVALNCTEANPGDVLICRLAEPVGRACIAPNLNSRMITSVDVCILKTRSSLDARFMTYLLSSPEYLGYMEGQCRGGTRDRVSRSFLGSVRMPVPPPTDQSAIVDFLDRETAKIDALVEEQQRLIELLKEKRQAVISHAVTRGLGPNAPMKNSGVEWLGEVPAHWEVSALKRHWSVTDCKHITAEFVDEGVPVASIREAQSKFVDLDDANLTTEEYYEQLIEGGRKPRPGDVIFTRNATVGEVAQVAEWHPPFALGQDVCLLRKLSPELSSDFLQQVMWSAVIAHQIGTVMIGSTFKRVNVEEIRNLIIPVPSPVEQTAIAAFLDSTMARIDSLIAESATAINLLRERRAALISAAVTGKIDVCGLIEADALLPDVVAA